MLTKLIGNENMKIYRRLRTWILLAIIVIATILVALIMHNTQHPNPNWKQNLVAENASIQKNLNQNGAKMPQTSVQIAKRTFQLNEYYITHNVDPEQVSSWKFSVSAENLSSLLLAFIVVIAGDIVASEFSSGTIKMLLTQTATRSQILLSKYLAVMFYALLMTIAMLVSSLLVGGIFFGFAGAGAPNVYFDVNGHIQYMTTAAYLLMKYGFLFIEIIITTTIAFMISAIFRSSVLAITISILAYLVGNTLVLALSHFSWVKYILFANTNLSQYVQGGPPIKGMTLGFSITMLALYFIVMNALSWLIFVKRDVSYT